MLGPSSLTEEAARVLTDEVKADAAALWGKLLRLYEGGAHLALGFSSWGAFWEAEFGQSHMTGYRLLDAARVAEALGSNQLVTESVARELAPVLRDDPEQVETVWAEAVAEHGPAPTAAQVRETVEKRACPMGQSVGQSDPDYCPIVRFPAVERPSRGPAERRSFAGNTAEGAGFEPAIALRRLRFSRPVHSTALPPLRSDEG